MISNADITIKTFRVFPLLKLFSSGFTAILPVTPLPTVNPAVPLERQQEQQSIHKTSDGEKRGKDRTSRLQRLFICNLSFKVIDFFLFRKKKKHSKQNHQETVRGFNRYRCLYGNRIIKELHYM